MSDTQMPPEQSEISESFMAAIKKHLSRKSGAATVILRDPVLEEKLREKAAGDHLPPSMVPGSQLGKALPKCPWVAW